jgi:hypothetical protein
MTASMPIRTKRLWGAAPAVAAASAALLATWAAPAHAANPSGTFKWVSVKSGRCTDADLNTIGSNGTKVQLWDCNGSRQQNWISSNNGTIKNSRSQKCLDADLNTIGSNGTKVQLWDCNGSRQQKWAITPGASAGSHRIISVYNGRCVDADLNTIGGNGTRVQLWDCNSQPQQDWRTLYF